jgi:hypothetical protein
MNFERPTLFLVALVALCMLLLPAPEPAAATAGAGTEDRLCICEVQCRSGRPGIWEWEATYGCSYSPEQGWNWPECNYGWEPVGRRLRCLGRQPIPAPQKEVAR